MSTDCYTIRCTIISHIPVSTMVRSIQEAYDNGSVAGSFQIMQDEKIPSVYHVEFTRYISEDTEYINKLVEERGYDKQRAACIQMVREFGDVPNDTTVSLMGQLSGSILNLDVRGLS